MTVSAMYIVAVHPSTTPSGPRVFDVERLEEDINDLVSHRGVPPRCPASSAGWEPVSGESAPRSLPSLPPPCSSHSWLGGACAGRHPTACWNVNALPAAGVAPGRGDRVSALEKKGRAEWCGSGRKVGTGHPVALVVVARVRQLRFFFAHLSAATPTQAGQPLRVAQAVDRGRAGGRLGVRLRRGPGDVVCVSAGPTAGSIGCAQRAFCGDMRLYAGL